MPTKSIYRKQRAFVTLFELPVQKEVVACLRRSLVPPAFVVAFLNGRQMGKGACFHGGKLGTRPGMPDLMIFAPDAKILAIELKRQGRRSSQSKDQKDVENDLVGCGNRYVICESLGDVLLAVRDFNIPLNSIPVRVPRNLPY